MMRFDGISEDVCVSVLDCTSNLVREVMDKERGWEISALVGDEGKLRDD